MTTPSDEEQRKAAEAAHSAMYGARNKPGFGNYYHLPAEYLYVGASAAWSVGHEAGLAAGRAEREVELVAARRLRCSRARERAEAAEQKLAALVEGLRALCGKSSVFVTVGAIDALLQSAAPDKTTPRHNAEKEST